MLKDLELDIDAHYHLLDYCKKTRIGFLSSGFDIESIDFLNELDLDFFKIPSGEITNLPYLIHVAKKEKPIVLSTGMSNLNEISEAIEILIKNGVCKDNLTILHCNTEYPTPFKDVNLNAMNTIKNHFGLKIGYSDHTPGIEVSIAAVALGARVIEKHFTLDKNFSGPDHIASLDPHELKKMVNSIRNIECSLGSDKKMATLSEKKNIDILRKSIVASRDIRKGELFTNKNLTTKGPAMEYHQWNGIALLALSPQKSLKLMI